MMVPELSGRMWVIYNFMGQRRDISEPKALQVIPKSYHAELV